MPIFQYNRYTTTGVASLGAVLLAACGGGGNAPDHASAAAPAASLTAPATALAGDTGTQAGSSALLSLKPANPLTPAPPLGVPAPVGTTLTTLQLVSKSTLSQTNVPLTFGQVFAPGAFPSTGGLIGVYGGAQLPLQVNIKARHPDGSVRHAIISTVVPQMLAGQSAALALNAAAAPPPIVATGPGSLLASGFDSTVKLTVAGQLYTASAAQLLQSTAYQTWLSGPMVNEWQVSAPFKSAAGVNHPHLSARFAIRSYSGVNGKVRVDVTIENNWAYEPDPKNVTYDAEVLINGKSIYNIAALNHYHHARWRKVFWPGLEPAVHIKHDIAYLIASKAVPNYDRGLTIAPSALTAMKTAWDAAKPGPMGMAMVDKYMPATGGRPDIGLNHAWGAMYLLSMDERAKEVTVGLSDLSGSWPMHYRDRNNRPAGVHRRLPVRARHPHQQRQLQPGHRQVGRFADLYHGRPVRHPVHARHGAPSIVLLPALPGHGRHLPPGRAELLGQLEPDQPESGLPQIRHRPGQEPPGARTGVGPAFADAGSLHRAGRSSYEGLLQQDHRQ